MKFNEEANCRRALVRIIGISFLLIFISTTCYSNDVDNYLWLEELKSKSSKEWVFNQNQKTISQFVEKPRYQEIRSNILSQLQSNNSPNTVFYIGNLIGQIDKVTPNSKGILKTISIKESYQPNPRWSIQIDFDELSKTEQKDWVYGDSVCNFDQPNQCMVSLSLNGSDEKEYREFDLSAGQFVKNGIVIPIGTTSVAWNDKDSLFFASTYDGKNTSKSGFPTKLHLLNRHQKLTDAKVIYQGKNIGGVLPKPFISNQKKYMLIQHWTDYYNGFMWLYYNNKMIEVGIPTSHEVYGVHDGFAIVKLYEKWQANGVTYPDGSVVGVDLNSLDLNKPKLELIFEQNPSQAFELVNVTRSNIVINVLSELVTYPVSIKRNKGKWVVNYIKKPSNDVLSINSASNFHNEIVAEYSGFLNPSTNYFIDTEKYTHRLWSETPKAFETENLSFGIHFAKGSDGVSIPYQMVGPKNLDPNKHYPVIIYVYGAYGDARTAWYSESLGTEWLSRDAIYVIANVRGGGAYGDSWRKAALRTTKHKTVDDVATVAKELIKKGITVPSKLGLYGGSLGGFAACSTLVRYPELFNAVICKAAILDLERFTELFDGNSWIGEFGDPNNPNERAYILKHSPFHSINPSKDYPIPLLISYANDDRVHPGHARKMAARMHDFGYGVYLYEHPNGGHGGASTKEGKALVKALQYEYFLQRLSD